MIYGIGIDTTTISRVARSMENPRFLQCVFGEEERALFEARGNKPAVAAANFAAKEAFGKALGTGIFGAFGLSEVQILRKESGEPYLVLSGKAARLLTDKNLTVRLSLTHEGDSATAIVVLEENE